jgi:hypothetical protein
MWAADFWTTKPFTEWNEKEVAKILSGSPWVAKVTISAPGGGGFPGGGGGGGGGGRGGGRGAGGGDASTGDASSGPGGDSRGGGGGGAGPGGGGGGGESIGVGGGGIPVSLIWQTALPIKQALMKRQYGAEAGTSPEAKAKLERVEQYYVLTMVGMPGSLLGAAQGDKKAALLELTTLTANGKPPIKAIDVQTAGGRGTSTVSFAFPRSTPFTVEDKEVEFSSKFDKTGIKKKFKLKDLVFNGKVEM